MMSSGARPSCAERMSKGRMGVYGDIVHRCGRMKSPPLKGGSVDELGWAEEG